MAREFYGTGRRKNAIAKVWLVPGEGRMTVNGKPMEDYVKRPTLAIKVREPLEAASVVGSFDVRGAVPRWRPLRPGRRAPPRPRPRPCLHG